MHRKLLILLLVVAVLIGPGLSVVSAAPTFNDHDDCRYSMPTYFHATEGRAYTTGFVNERFSTLRSAIGGPAIGVFWSDATFDVVDVQCSGQFWWVQIQYTSGEFCEFPTWYGHHPYINSPYCDLEDAAGMTGWALESQIWFDGWFGPGRWLSGP